LSVLITWKFLVNAMLGYGRKWEHDLVHENMILYKNEVRLGQLDRHQYTTISFIHSFLHYTQYRSMRLIVCHLPDTKLGYLVGLLCFCNWRQKRVLVYYPFIVFELYHGSGGFVCQSAWQKRGSDNSGDPFVGPKSLFDGLSLKSTLGSKSRIFPYLLLLTDGKYVVVPNANRKNNHQTSSWILSKAAAFLQFTA
jgi:hypothetical protein